MKCIHCGNELKVGSVYCEACGKEAQIVPDYNILEDDILTSLLEEKKGTADEKKSSITEATSDKNKQKKNVFQRLWANKKLRISFILSVILVIFLIIFGVSMYMNSYSYQYKRGIHYDQAKAYEKAIEHYQKAIDLKDNSIQARYAAGKDYYKIKSYDEAEKILLEAVEIDNTNTSVFKMLLKVYLATDAYDKISELEDMAGSQKVLALFDEYLVAPPEFSEDEGEYEDDLALELTSEDDYDIYYTIDGSDPAGDKGIRYNEAIELADGTTTVKAACCNEKGEFGQIVAKKYEITYVAPDYPVVSPMSGTFTTPTQISVETIADASVYYTWDGSVPSASSALYTGPIDVPEGNNVLSLLVIDKHGLCSDVLKCNYKYMP